MRQARVRLGRALVMSAMAAGVATACGQGGGELPTATPEAALAFASSSGGKVLAARTFRVSLEDRGRVEYNTACQLRTRVEAAVDLDRKVARYRLDDGTDAAVVLTPGALYASASALPGWRVDRSWLAVPFGDARNLANVVPALRSSFAFDPNLFSSATASATNPATAFSAIKETASRADDRGREAVRGVETTRFDLTIDPARAGVWTGRNPSPGGTTVPAGDALRARRERLLAMIDAGADGTRVPLTDDLRAAILNGDVEPLIAARERVTGTTMKASDREGFRVMASGDWDAYFRSVEAATGTTMGPEERQFTQSLIDGALKGDGGLGAFNAFTTVRATVWVDDDGVLRRFDYRVSVDGENTTTTSGRGDAPIVDVRAEYFDVGAPIGDGEPPDGEVRRVADLRPGQVPTHLAPCNARIPATTR